jgi:hypothetical protein
MIFGEVNSKPSLSFVVGIAEGKISTARIETSSGISDDYRNLD